ncbi:MAG: hypothetical protein JXA87_04435 [Thermoleophilia bacterium]|nr:hypothetical protein [Thermoleophilia bacterium]
MKRLWKRKWLVIPVASVIFLSVGAVAWATTGGEPADEVGSIAGEAGALAAVVSVGDEAGAKVREAVKEAAVGLKKAMEAAREHWREKRADRAAQEEALREEMTSEDKALYDALLEKLEGQRAELRELREEMKETVDGLRELRKKYRTDED